MNNFYVVLKKHNGKLVDKSGTPVVADMSNDEHVKALNIRQKFLNKGISDIKVDAKMQCDLKFWCACGNWVSISGNCDVEFELGDAYLDIDPMEFKLDKYHKKCIECGTEFELIVNEDNELILKPKN